MKLNKKPQVLKKIFPNLIQVPQDNMPHLQLVVQSWMDPSSSVLPASHKQMSWIP